MGHESFQREAQVVGSSNRSFGFVFGAVFALIGLWPLLFGGQLRVWALAVAGIFLLVAVAFPATLAPLNRLWLKFGLVLHKIVSPIVLGVMFFLVVTPIGLLMRALGKDLLRLRFDRSVRSYWIPREPAGPAPETLKDQF